MNAPYTAIAAMSLNRVIGRGNKIPWHLPEDFKWFKQTTMGGTLIMGRKTFESIGRPLPGRTTVVLSHSAKEIPGVHIARSWDEIDSKTWPGHTFIVGGSEIYRQAMPKCKEIYLTVVQQTIPDGDAFFPEFEADFAPPTVVQKSKEFTIYHFLRR